ncbi:MAG: acyl carrier protein [Myxococcota bacterium]
MEPSTRDTLAAELRAHLARRGHPSSDEADSLRQLGLDSAEILELVADLEDRHGVEIPLNELVQVRTFGQMVDQLHRRIGP